MCRFYNQIKIWEGILISTRSQTETKASKFAKKGIVKTRIIN